MADKLKYWDVFPYSVVNEHGKLLSGIVARFNDYSVRYTELATTHWHELKPPAGCEWVDVEIVGVSAKDDTAGRRVPVLIVMTQPQVLGPRRVVFQTAIGMHQQWFEIAPPPDVRP